MKARWGSNKKIPDGVASDSDYSVKFPYWNIGGIRKGFKEAFVRRLLGPWALGVPMSGLRGQERSAPPSPPRRWRAFTWALGRTRKGCMTASRFIFLYSNICLWLLAGFALVSDGPMVQDFCY
jgi:hypothetical protein